MHNLGEDLSKEEVDAIIQVLVCSLLSYRRICMHMKTYRKRMWMEMERLITENSPP